MSTLQVFDKPLCCSSGVCGPDVDPALVMFSADLQWLERQGVQVQRINPAPTSPFRSQRACARRVEKPRKQLLASGRCE